MTEHLLIALTSIIVIGISAQWLAWKIRVPAILLLLLAGFLAGPVTGFIKPDALMGDLLVPVVSLSVAIILFEGSLSLSASEFKKIGKVVRNLVTIGALATWILAAAAAHYIAGLAFSVAILFGAILVVTGPTVIIPLLRHVRPTANIGSILRWEGILIDPVGATLAVLVFEALVAGGPQQATAAMVMGFVKTVLVGGGMGLLGAFVTTQLLSRYWVPDYLDNSLVLMMVLAVFTSANLIQHESGLLAVTVMGVALANQEKVSVKHIIRFKEDLRVLLLAFLFILLPARLQFSDLAQLRLGSFIFLAVMIFLVRPLSVFLATIRTSLNWREKIFIAAIAPRGVVAAAVSSAFALRLERAGYTEAEGLVPLIFLIIVGTVTIYGLAASPLARRLKLANPNPQGVLIISAHQWAREIAMVLKGQEIQVVLVDTNWQNLYASRLNGLQTYYGSALGERILEELDMGGIGRVIALTSNDEVNSLVCLHFAEIVGRSEVYQLSPKIEEKARNQSVSQHFRGRVLFGSGLTYQSLAQLFEDGRVIRATKLTQAFTYEDYVSTYGETAVPLFLITKLKELIIFSSNNQPVPETGQLLISLVKDEEALLTETFADTQEVGKMERYEGV